MAVCNYAKILVFNRILATKSEIQYYQSVKVLKHRWILRLSTLTIDITKIEACKLAFISLYKISCPVLTNRTLYHFFRKTADNTACWRQSSIGKAIYLLY
jgi:hypothetical protein